MPTLIETVRVRGGAAPLWGHHLHRLFTSCRELGVPHPLDLPTPDGGPDRVHRLEVGPRGTATTERPVVPVGPLALVTSRHAHRPYPHKTTARELFDAALAEARAAGADEPLLAVAGGPAAEGARFAVLWWEGDRVAGPPFELGVLRSVGRRRVDELVGGIAERVLPPGELADHGAFLVNAVHGVVPAASIDGRTVHHHPGTGRLQALFWG
jgi:branched-subunit amino acid aminotransferase/4-amino-4-deoxychorismate lyase